jgi:hypothetical protein
MYGKNVKIKKVYLFSLILFGCIIWKLSAKFNNFHIRYSVSAHFPARWTLPPGAAVPLTPTPKLPNCVLVSVHYVPSHEFHAPCSSYNTSFDRPQDTWRGVQIIKLLITRFYSIACYFILLMSNQLPQHPVLECPRSTAYPLCEIPHLTPYEMTRKIVFFLYKDFHFHVFG